MLIKNPDARKKINKFDYIKKVTLQHTDIHKQGKVFVECIENNSVISLILKNS